MATKRAGLGKNLNALLGSAVVSKKTASDDSQVLTQLSVDALQAGQYQPRQDMDQAALQELADSIREQGIIQPIVVRPVSATRYEIIAGERRWRAAQIAGSLKVPAIIKDISDEETIALALIENIQREDLSPMDEARGIARLQQEFELTHQQIATLLSKSRTAVSNSLRLMKLSDDVKRLLDHGDIDMGHARALLTLPLDKQSELAKLVAAKGLSVRETEHMARQILQPPVKKIAKRDLSPHLVHVRDSLCSRLGCKVNIEQQSKERGKLVIHYDNLVDLDGIIEQISEK